MDSDFFKVFDKKKCFDLRLKNPSSFILAGSSQCGKTTFTLKLLKNIPKMFQDPRCQQNVLYFYKEWQDSYEKFKDENIVSEWINRLPTVEDVKEKTHHYKENGGSVIVIDDFAQQLNKDIASIFTVLCHHTKSVVILLTQNLFSKNPVFRDISLNATYVVLFKNPRDASQISIYAKQFAPGKNKYVVEAFECATEEPYSYVLFDHHQSSSSLIRMRTNIFPDEAPIRVYVAAEAAEKKDLPSFERKRKNV